jgi:hypothetical protein
MIIVCCCSVPITLRSPFYSYDKWFWHCGLTPISTFRMVWYDFVLKQLGNVMDYVVWHGVTYIPVIVAVIFVYHGYLSIIIWSGLALACSYVHMVAHGTMISLVSHLRMIDCYVSKTIPIYTITVVFWTIWLWNITVEAYCLPLTRIWWGYMSTRKCNYD